MDAKHIPSQDASSTDAAVPPFTALPPPANGGEEPGPASRTGALEACSEQSRRGHLPDIVDPLVPAHPETAFTQTRRLRRDGWTPPKMRAFLERLAECGVVAEACQTAGMSARAAYNLRDRDPLFAAGWEAACVFARPRLADEAFSRAMNGVVERIYKDGAIVAERHRYDNKLTMSVLGRLDARIDRAEEQGALHLGLTARWDDYLAALAEDRREDALRLLAPSDLQESTEDNELHELQESGDRVSKEAAEAAHKVWKDYDGRWVTNFPPPDDFKGRQYGRYGDARYTRPLSPSEQAVIDAREAEKVARAAAERDAHFGLAPPPPGGADAGQA